MPKVKELSTDLRLKVIDKRQGGASFGTIANDLSIPKSTAVNICRKYEATGRVTSEPREGRPMILSERNRRYTKILALQDRGNTVSEITNEVNRLMPANNNICAATVRRLLHKKGINKRKAVRKPLINARNRAQRVLWARDHVNWTMQQWSRVIWSDEVMVDTSASKRYMQVWRRPGEKYNRNCLCPTMKSGNTSAHFWGAIRWNGIASFRFLPLGTMNGERYVNTLQENLLPILNNNHIFQHDNAPCHKSAPVRQWLANNNVNVMIWPAQSPDLSPIENIWGIMKQKFYKLTLPDRRRITIAAAFENIWNNISVQDVRSCIRSMRRRCQQVIEKHGYPLKY